MCDLALSCAVVAIVAPSADYELESTFISGGISVGGVTDPNPKVKSYRRRGTIRVLSLTPWVFIYFQMRIVPKE